MAMTAFLDAAIGAIGEIRERLAITPRGELLKSYSKGAGGDVSIGADLLCESVLYSYLAPFGILDTEESGRIDSMESFHHNPFLVHTITPKEEGEIIIDPLDGSDNFSANIPYYGVAIARTDAENKTQAAVVANYCSGEIFFRDKHYDNGGVFVVKDGQVLPYMPSKSPRIGIFESAFKHGLLAATLYKNGYKMRSFGALAVSLAYVRVVRFLLYRGRFRKYDLRAGLFLTHDAYVYEDAQTLLLSYDKKSFEHVQSLLCQG